MRYMKQALPNYLNTKHVQKVEGTKDLIRSRKSKDRQKGKMS
jgi:hypothetical protein